MSVISSVPDEPPRHRYARIRDLAGGHGTPGVPKGDDPLHDPAFRGVVVIVALMIAIVMYKVLFQ